MTNLMLNIKKTNENDDQMDYLGAMIWALFVNNQKDKLALVKESRATFWETIVNTWKNTDPHFS